MSDELPEPHQWTNGGARVLMVKCLNRDGTSGKNNSFVWPKSGPVNPVTIGDGREADCESGGLFGWPWGLFVGDGKDPDACANWIVFSAMPENAISMGGGKCKAVRGKDGSDAAIVEYYGDMGGAMYLTSQGRIALVMARSSGSASATGSSGSASATGARGSASATGYRGSASATGSSGSASATGDSGSASATGDSGSASATGKDSWALAGMFGRASAEKPDGMIAIFYRDKNNRRRLCVGYIGEDGIEAGMEYRVEGGKLVKSEEAKS